MDSQTGVGSQTDAIGELLFANYSQTFMPQSSIASYIGDLPPESSNAYEVSKIRAIRWYHRRYCAV